MFASVEGVEGVDSLGLPCLTSEDFFFFFFLGFSSSSELELSREELEPLDVSVSLLPLHLFPLLSFLVLDFDFTFFLSFCLSDFTEESLDSELSAELEDLDLDRCLDFLDFLLELPCFSCLPFFFLDLLFFFTSGSSDSSDEVAATSA